MKTVVRAMRQHGPILAVDPGEVHVGVASFVQVLNSMMPEFGTWMCHSAGEMSPTDFTEWFWINGAIHRAVICESFHLYPWKMQEQGYSQMKTVELIGVLRWMCMEKQVDFIEQKATIKAPTLAHAKRMEYEWKSKGKGGHARDAETHGLYYLKEVNGWT